jgi:hypothetical protein
MLKSLPIQWVAIYAKTALIKCRKVKIGVEFVEINVVKIV